MDNPNIEIFNDEDSPNTRLQLVIKEITLHEESLEKAKLQGNTLLPIDDEIWRAIYDPESMSQLTQDSFSQSTQGVYQPGSRKKDVNEGPIFIIQKHRETDDEEDEDEDDEEEDEEDEDDEEDDEEDIKDNSRRAEAIEKAQEDIKDNFRKAKAIEKAAERNAVDLDDESRDTSQGNSEYSDASIVWRGDDDETLDHDVLAVETSLSQIAETRSKWRKTPYHQRDETFYKEAVKNELVTATTNLMEESNIPIKSFNQWKDHIAYFIGGKSPCLHVTNPLSSHLFFNRYGSSQKNCSRLNC